MDDNVSADNNQEKANNAPNDGTPSVEIPKVVIGEELNRQEPDGTQGEPKTKLQRFVYWLWKDTSFTDWIMALFTIVIAFAAWQQWREMIGAGVQTGQLVESAGKQVRAAKKMGGAASRQADAAQQFSDTADDINAGISGAVDQLQTAANNAKNALDASIEAAHLDERAWVGIQGFSGGPIISGDHVSHAVAVVAKNTGKTPALRVSGKYIQVWTEVRDPVPEYATLRAVKGSGGVATFLWLNSFHPEMSWLRRRPEN